LNHIINKPVKFGKIPQLIIILFHCFIVQGGPDNILGIKSLLERKAVDAAVPQESQRLPEIGVVYHNLGRIVRTLEPPSENTVGKLVLKSADVVGEVRELIRKLGLLCNVAGESGAGNIGHHVKSINLYYKIGRGSLDMYVVHPADLPGKLLDQEKTPQHEAQSSISSVIVWRPSVKSSHKKPVRIFFTSNVSQSKIFAGLDSLKTEKIFQTWSGLVPETSVDELRKSASATTGPAKTGKVTFPDRGSKTTVTTKQTEGNGCAESGGDAKDSSTRQIPQPGHPPSAVKVAASKDIRKVPAAASAGAIGGKTVEFKKPAPVDTKEQSRVHSNTSEIKTAKKPPAASAAGAEEKRQLGASRDSSTAASATENGGAGKKPEIRKSIGSALLPLTSVVRSKEVKKPADSRRSLSVAGSAPMAGGSGSISNAREIRKVPGPVGVGAAKPDPKDAASKRSSSSLIAAKKPTDVVKEGRTAALNMTVDSLDMKPPSATSTPKRDGKVASPAKLATASKGKTDASPKPKLETAATTTTSASGEGNIYIFISYILFKL